ncbi:MAG: hypothetical protein IKL05_05670 [Clostridia bacterium]|nr:hypothetical protein [Clostridia bacterium]
MNVNIPEKYRTEFDKATDFAVEKQVFAPSELAEHLGTGVLVASIMVGYMEKAGFVTKGKSDDVRRVKISLEEWDAIDRDIERFVPPYEPEPQVFTADTEDNTEIDFTDILSAETALFNKKLGTENGLITITDKEGKIAIAPEDIATLFLHRGGLFAKGTLTLSPDRETPVKAKLRADTLAFKKRDYNQVKALAQGIAEKLGVEITEF